MASARTRVTAVHDDDSLELLKLLGAVDAYQSGALTCTICGLPLVERGLGAARKRGDEVEFACERLDCLEEFHAG